MYSYMEHLPVAPLVEEQNNHHGMKVHINSFISHDASMVKTASLILAVVCLVCSHGCRHSENEIG